MSKKFCPFMSIPGPTEHISKAPCMEKDCPLWLEDPFKPGCSLHVLADYLAGFFRERVQVIPQPDRKLREPREAVF